MSPTRTIRPLEALTRACDAREALEDRSAPDERRDFGGCSVAIDAAR